MSDISSVLEMSGRLSEYQATGIQLHYDDGTHLRVRWTQDGGL